MKPLLLGDRAKSAVPAHSSLVSRFGVWARESLVARGVAVASGLLLLAAIGGSALAGGLSGKMAAKAAPEEPAVLPPLETNAPRGSASAAVTLTAAAVTSPNPPDSSAVPLEKPQPMPEAVAARSSPAASRATPEDPVELNSAKAEDLRRLPGVGEKRAEAILALRAHLPGGRFRQLEDLLKVKGIGRAMLKRLHPLVRLA